MKKGVILYQSKYGATKKYAEWLKEATSYDMVETKKASINNILEYETVVLGGGIYASGIAGLGFLKKNINALKGKNLIVFCVGASPYDERAYDEMYKHNFRGELAGIKCIYCRGAWKEDEMTFVDRNLCKLLQKTVAKKEPNALEPWEKALMSAVGQNVDWTDKKYIEELVNELNRKK